MIWYGAPISLFLLSILVISLVGIWASNVGIERFKVHDPKQVVIDEVAGQGIACIACTSSLTSMLLALALFRFFDILKPWPISLVDRKVKGGLGVMLDDLIAGVLALGVLKLVQGF